MTKILIVEDEPKAGDYLKQGLREAGYAIDLVINGVDGLHPVSYTHLRAHETPAHLVCRLPL